MTYRDALVLSLGGGVTLPILPAFDDPQIPERHNLRVLARGPGTPIRAVVMPLATRAPAARLLAVRSEALALPNAWKGLVNITLDKIESHVLAEPLARPHLLQAPSPAADPLYIPQRRLKRVVMGGVRTLVVASTKTDWEAVGLAASMMPRGAALMAALVAAATSGGQDLQGRQRPPAPEVFARAWLACSAWTRSASKAARRRGWSP